jgi:hypothetical protein
MIVPFKVCAVNVAARIVLLSGICVWCCVPVCTTFEALPSKMRAQFSMAVRAVCSQTGNLFQSLWQHQFLCVGKFAQFDAFKTGPFGEQSLGTRPEFFESRFDE